MASKALDRGYKNDFFQESLIKYEVHTMSITSMYAVSFRIIFLFRDLNLSRGRKC